MSATWTLGDAVREVLLNGNDVELVAALSGHDPDRLRAEVARRAPRPRPSGNGLVQPRPVRPVPPEPEQPPALLPYTTLDQADDTPPPRVTTEKSLPLWTGMLASLAGEGESGKSFIAAHTILDLARQRRRVLIVDGEMTAGMWRRRLNQIGAQHSELARIAYTPMNPATAGAVPALMDTCRHLEAALIGWDSAGSLISHVARSENDNVEVTRAYDRLRAVCRGDAEHPPVAGLIVDHTAKNGSSMPRGATAKFNGVDVQYGVSVVVGTIPNPANEWAARITVEKDRGGLLARRDMIAAFHPLGGGSTDLDIAATFDQTHRFSGDDPVDQMVDQITGMRPAPTSGNDAYRRLGGRKSVVLAAFKRWQEQ